MKTLLYILIALVLTTSNIIAKPLNNPTSNLAANILVPIDDTHTQQSAKVYWLPDFLGDNTGYTKRNNDGGKNETPEPCLKEKPDTNLYDVTQEMHNAQMCYVKKCKAKFMFTSSNCLAGWSLGGSSCEGKYEACRSNPCSVGGYYDYEQTNKICSAVSYGGKTCHSCRPPVCSDEGLEATKTKPGYACTRTAANPGLICYRCQPCSELMERAQPYGCKEYHEQCRDKCTEPYPDNCHNRTAVDDSRYGCKSKFKDCKDKCQVAYPNNCRNRPKKDCEFGCMQWFEDCGTRCEYCKKDPACEVNSLTCVYGCKRENSCKRCLECRPHPDCEVTSLTCAHGCAKKNSCDKCISCTPDPCDSVTAKEPPANASCLVHCGEKCATWGCNSGYSKSGDGNSCVKDSACVYADSCPGYTSDDEYTNYDGYLMENGSCTACGITKYSSTCNNPGRDYDTCVKEDCNWRDNCPNDADYCSRKEGFCKACCSDCPNSRCYYIY